METNFANCGQCREMVPVSHLFARGVDGMVPCRHCRSRGPDATAARVYYRNLKERPCVDCGGQYPHYVMQFDHRDPSTKAANVSTLANGPIAELAREAAKCDLVCANCHAERTHQQGKAGLLRRKPRKTD